MCRALLVVALVLPIVPETFSTIERLVAVGGKGWMGACKRFDSILFYLIATLAKRRHALHGATASGLASEGGDETHDLSQRASFYFTAIAGHLKIPPPEATGCIPERTMYRSQDAMRLVKGALAPPVKSFAKWLAYAVVDAPEAIMPLLQAFIMSIDSYCHPSNAGKWTDELVQLLHMNILYVARIASSAPPGALAICREGMGLKKLYAAAMWAPLERLVLAKNPYTAMAAISATKGLAYLEPSSVIPQIAIEAIQNFQSLGEPHRMLASMGLVARIARLKLESEEPLALHLPPGPGASPHGYGGDGALGGGAAGLSFCTLLTLAIPGVDYNDPFKTATTLNLFANVLYSMPLVSSPHPQAAPGGGTAESAQAPLLPESFCEEFASLLLDASLSYIDNVAADGHMAVSAGDGASSSPLGPLERSIFASFAKVWTLFFLQCPAELHSWAVQRIALFVREARKGPLAARLAAALMQAAKGRNSKLLLDSTLPSLTERVLGAISEGVGCGVSESASRSSSLVWNLSCLLGCVRYATDAIAEHADSITRLLKVLPLLRQPVCARLAAKVVKAVVRSLADYYPLHTVQAGPDHFAEKRRRRMMGEVASLIEPSVVSCDAVITWHIPCSTGTALADGLLRSLSKDLLQEARGSAVVSNEQLRTIIVLAASIIKGAAIRHGTPLADELIGEWMPFICHVIADHTAPIEGRDGAIDLLWIVAVYSGSFPNRIRSIHAGMRSWKGQLQSYPRHKAMPPIWHAEKALLAHRRVQDLVKSIARPSLFEAHPQTLGLLFQTSCDHFSRLRRSSQWVLLTVLSRDSVQSLDLFFTRLPEALMVASSVADESTIKGCLHLLGSVHGTKIACRTVERADRILRLGGALIANAALALIPNVYDMLLRLLSDIAVRTHGNEAARTMRPTARACLKGSPPTACREAALDAHLGSGGGSVEQMLAWHLAKCADPATGWRVQLVSLWFLSTLATLPTISDESLCSVAASFLRAMVSEVNEIRSHAVNRGIAILHRATRLCASRTSPLAASLADWDAIDCAPQLGAARQQVAAAAYISIPPERPALPIETLMPMFIKWVLQEPSGASGNGPSTQGNSSAETVPPFRTDICELFQSVADYSGGPSLARLTFITLHSASSGASHAIGYQRAFLEATAGLARSLMIVAPLGESNGASLADVSRQLIEALSTFGIESVRYWYDCARFAFDRFTMERARPLLDPMEASLVSAAREGNCSTTRLALHMSFLAGAYRATPPTWSKAQALMDGTVGGLLGSPFDAVRRMASTLAVVLLRSLVCTLPGAHNAAESGSGPCAREQAGTFVGILVKGATDGTDEQRKRPFKKSLLLLVERCSQDPARTLLWSWLPSIVAHLVAMQGDGDVEVQRGAKSICKVISWASHMPPPSREGGAGADRSAICSILALAVRAARGQEQHAGSTASAQRGAIEMARIMYHRNAVANSPCNGALATTIISSLLTDESVLVRNEAAEFLMVILHGDPRLAEQLSAPCAARLATHMAEVKGLAGVAGRHGAVLLALSLVLSRPYGMALWMAPLLTSLARFLGDRDPIPSTVRRVFSEFKRTHADTWQVDQAHFDEDQLYLIRELLVAPSYYA